MATSVEWHGDKFIRQLEKEQIKALNLVADFFQNQLKSVFKGHGSGKHGKPSPPGTPPAVQTGRLRLSIQTDKRKNKGKNPLVRVGTNVEYAAIHEFGGRAGRGRKTMLPARPYMRPTFNRNKKKMIQIYQKSIAAFIAKFRS